MLVLLQNKIANPDNYLNMYTRRAYNYVIMLLITLISITEIDSQTVTVDAPCFGAPFDFTLSGMDGTGRNIYNNAMLQTDVKYNPVLMRWEIIGGPPDNFVFYATGMNTFSPNPPDSGTETWNAILVGCTGTATVTGSGTQNMPGGNPCDMLGGDTDMDGVCDDNDICPGFDDNADMDNDGIPDGCDPNPMTPDGILLDASCIDPMNSYLFTINGNDGNGRNIYSNFAIQMDVKYNAMAGQWEIRAMAPATEVFFTNAFASLPDPPDHVTSPWVGVGMTCDMSPPNSVDGTGTQSTLGCDLLITNIDSTGVACGNDTDGTITITATSSNGPITYSITGPVNDSNMTGNFTGLAAGMYSINVTDDSFPAGQCDSTATATILISDATPPQITCPTNINMGTDPNMCDAVVTFMDPVGTDNCMGAMTMQTAGMPSGSTFPLGLSMATFTVTDAAGLTASCSFTITVDDMEDPAITCPPNITMNVDAGMCTAIVTYIAPVGTDNCPGATTMQTAGLGSGMSFPVGTTTETYLVTDAANNTAQCSFDIVVNDGEPPVVMTQPFTLYLDANGMGTLLPSDVDNGSSDNCTLMLSLDNDVFTCTEEGSNTVMLMADDGSNPPVSMSATVTVSDTVTPVIICQDISIALDENNMASIIPADVVMSITDACGVADTTLSMATFDETNLGDNMILVATNDVNGNPRTCQAIVMVGEFIPIPTLSQWGLLVLTISLLIFGTVFIRQEGLTMNDSHYL